MEPSPSLDATITLRTEQGESHFGARAMIDPASGTVQTAHEDLPTGVESRHATLRAVAGRWLLDAAPEGRISVNAVALAGARIIIAGDVITIGDSQFLVEESQPRSLTLRRFALEGTDTLPPVGDSVRSLATPAEELTVDLGEIPDIEGAAPARATVAARSKLN